MIEQYIAICAALILVGIIIGNSRVNERKRIEAEQNRRLKYSRIAVEQDKNNAKWIVTYGDGSETSISWENDAEFITFLRDVKKNNWSLYFDILSRDSALFSKFYNRV